MAANTIVIGVMLGLSFGAGLLIQEARTGKLKPRDALLAISFLGLCHSLIEDTLLIMLLGADLSAILWAAPVFLCGDRHFGAGAATVPRPKVQPG